MTISKSETYTKMNSDLSNQINKGLTKLFIHVNPIAKIRKKHNIATLTPKEKSPLSEYL